MKELFIEMGELTPLNDQKPFLVGFRLEDGSSFYMEPAFHTQLINLCKIRAQSSLMIIKEIERIVKKSRKVLFVHDFENVGHDLKDYVIREMTDVLDPLGIFIEDKSRGSDYGD